MAEWNLKYEKGFILPEAEKNYILKTINDFVELTIKERDILRKILKEFKTNEHTRET